MDRKRINISILVILCTFLIVIGIFIVIKLSSDNSVGGENVNDKDDVILSGDNIGDEYDEKNNLDDDIVTDNSNVDFNNLINNITQDNSVQDSYSEEDVVNYFENMEYEVENSTSFKDKFKEYFITIVDFIFYDREIKGYTFDELTGTAKAKIIAVALKIDSKIEEYVPNYKESISNKTGKIYTNVKEKLVTSYMDISSAICKDNKEGCTKVKEIFSDVKDYCKIGWDFIKGLFKSGVIKLKDWYEIYSGK